MKMNNFFIGMVALLAIFQLNAQSSTMEETHSEVTTVNHQDHGKDIVDVAAGIDMFSTLVAAVKTADLVKTLKSEGPFTVFAPTNAAFEKLPKDTVDGLMAPEGKEQLTKILTYHVVAGTFKAEDVIKAIRASKGSFSIKTVSGDTLMASLDNGKVVLTDENGGKATVTKTDVAASNGIIHGIDSVVLPE